MPQLGIEQQLVMLANRLGTHIRGKLRSGDMAGARAALDRFGAFVADELRGANPAGTAYGLRVPSANMVPAGRAVDPRAAGAGADDDPVEGDVLPEGYRR